MGVVLDASVVVKWFIDEQRSGAARRAFSAKVKKGLTPFFWRSIGKVAGR
jgi:predicted nucleic acid-binding protein